MRGAKKEGLEMRTSHAGTRTLLALVFTAALLVTNSGTAHAHYMQSTHGSDVAWVDSTHDHLDVQDNECDGNYVYADGWSSQGFIRVWDSNGCSAGWGHGDGLNFYAFRICEQNITCSPTVQVT